MDGRIGSRDGEDEAGVSAAASDINERGGVDPAFFGDAQEFEGFGVMTLHHICGFNGSDTGVGGGALDEIRVALKKRKPPFVVGERWEERGKVKPIEIQGTPRSAITLRMIQLRA